MKDNIIIMAYLNELESAVIQAMCEREASESSVLRAQMETVEVTSRNNTGSGFYTYIKVDPSCVSLDQKIISNVFADIRGLKTPMAFVLFVRNGKIYILEGASVEDSTANIDFETVRFKIL